MIIQFNGNVYTVHFKYKSLVTASHTLIFNDYWFIRVSMNMIVLIWIQSEKTIVEWRINHHSIQG